MIKSLSVTNFQSHKSAELNFAPGVNVIIGASDSGKTAILRALNWIISNRPSGDAFRSSWGGATECRVDLTDGNWIARTKDKDGNQYELNAEVMKAMGQSVPEAISKVLNLNSINQQSQMDAPFLLSASAGEVAQTLNEVVGLEDIDKTLTAANRMVRAANQDMEREQAQIATMTAQKAAFDGLDGLDGMLTRLEDLNAALTRTRAQEAELNRLVIAATEVREQVVQMRRAADLWPELKAVLATDQKANTLAVQATNLEMLVENITSARAAIVKVRNVATLMPEHNELYAKYEKAFDTDIEIGKLAVFIGDASTIFNACEDARLVTKHSPELDLIIAKDVNADAIHTKIGALEALILEATTCCDKQVNGRNLLKNMIELYKTEMGNTCPLCERSF